MILHLLIGLKKYLFDVVKECFIGHDYDKVRSNIIKKVKILKLGLSMCQQTDISGGLNLILL